MIQLLAPVIAPALATSLGISVPMATALASGAGSLLSGGDLQDVMKSAALGGVGGKFGEATGLLGGGAEASLADAAVQEGATQSAFPGALQKLLFGEGAGADKGIGSLMLGEDFAKEGLLNPKNLMLMSMFLPRQDAPKRSPYIGGGYYGPGGKHVSARDVFPGYVEGGRILGPGTPTSDSIPATIYQDGIPVGEAALSTEEVVLSHKDLAALDPNGDYQKASQKIGNAKNGDRGRMAAELFNKMKVA